MLCHPQRADRWHPPQLVHPNTLLALSMVLFIYHLGSLVGKKLIESIADIPYISLTVGYPKGSTASPDQISSLLKGVSISHGGSGPVMIAAGNFVWSISSPSKSVAAGFATPGINVFTVAYGISIDDILSDLFSH